MAQEGASVVFVEVRERSSEGHGSAVESVTPAKRRKIVRAAHVYAAVNRLDERPLRFDVVSIDWGPEGPRVRHDRAAFDET